MRKVIFSVITGQASELRSYGAIRDEPCHFQPGKILWSTQVRCDIALGVRDRCIWDHPQIYVLPLSGGIQTLCGF